MERGLVERLCVPVSSNESRRCGLKGNALDAQLKTIIGEGYRRVLHRVFLQEHDELHAGGLSAGGPPQLHHERGLNRGPIRTFAPADWSRA